MIWNNLHRLMKYLTELGIFLLVWLIAGALLFAIGSTAWQLVKPKKDEIKVEANISDKKDGKSEITLKVDQVEKYGNLWIARIQEPKDSYSVDYHSSKSITRNLLLTLSKSDKTHILFDSYKNRITEFRALPDNDEAKVFVCSFIKNYNDSGDEDKAKVSLMLIDKNAEKQKVVIEDADRVLKIEKADDTLINIVYFKDSKLFSSTYALKDFKEVSNPAIFDLKNTDLKNSPLLIGEAK